MEQSIAGMQEVESGVFLGFIPGDGIFLDAPKSVLERKYMLKYGNAPRNDKDLNDFTKKLATHLAKRMGIPVHKRMKKHIMQY